MGCSDDEAQPRGEDPLSQRDPWRPCEASPESTRPEGHHLALFVEDEATLAQSEEEPEFYPLNVILDSGATDHVLSRSEVPGYSVEPSAGSRANRHYTDASGHPIVNEGEATVLVKLPAGNDVMNSASTTFQVADVTRPLLSVSKICEKGNDVLCRDKVAHVLDKEHNVVAQFEKRNGLYVSTLPVRNPKHQGFQRQAR